MNPLRFLPVARALAALSKDPSTQVGALLLDEDCNVLSTGYNGFPRGVADTPGRLQERATKLTLIAHAEANAIAQAARVGASTLGSTLLVTELHPCADCAKLIVQAGIRRVYAPRRPPIDNNRWDEQERIATLIFEEANIEVCRYAPDRSD